MKYSSLGYYLLAVIIEKVYKQSFYHILNDRILQPFKMSSTGLNNNRDIVKRMATGYQKVSDDSLMMAPYRDYGILQGAGDMFSSVDDLFKWSRVIMAGTCFEPATKQLVFTPNFTVGNKQNSGYGLGWYIKQPDLTPLAYHHGGGTWGYTSNLAIYPGEKISIIILCNVAPVAIESLWHDVEKMVFGMPFNMPVIEPEIALSIKEKGIYAGNYLSEKGDRKLNIILQQDKLFAKLEGRHPFEIFYKGNNTFFAKAMDIKLHFSMNDAGTIYSITANRAGQDLIFNKSK
jgi:CubicO group peptidase (beta-lactamase class C family)